MSRFARISAVASTLVVAGGLVAACSSSDRGPAPSGASANKVAAADVSSASSTASIASTSPAPSTKVARAASPRTSTSVATTAPGGGTGITTSASAAETRIVVVRPVTAQGTPAAGYSVSAEQVEAVERCHASPYMRESGVYECSPSAANAVACMKSTHGTLLCLFSTDSHMLHRVRPTDALPAVTAPADPVPLGLSLTSRVRCTAYYNGTNPTAGRLFAVYGCSQHVGIFAANFQHPFDVSTAQWTAHLFNADGSGAERRGYVQTAYYVGTAG